MRQKLSSINELKNELQKSVEHGHMTKNPISNFVGGDMSDITMKKLIYINNTLIK